MMGLSGIILYGVCFYRVRNDWAHLPEIFSVVSDPKRAVVPSANSESQIGYGLRLTEQLPRMAPT